MKTTQVRVQLEQEVVVLNAVVIDLCGVKYTLAILRVNSGLNCICEKGSVRGQLCEAIGDTVYTKSLSYV